MIVFYSKTCEGCAGNHALSRMKQFCKEHGVEFQERRTVLWERFEQEANSIMRANPGLTLPFFFNSETHEVLEGNTFTPTEDLQKLIG